MRQTVVNAGLSLSNMFRRLEDIGVPPQQDINQSYIFQIMTAFQEVLSSMSAPKPLHDLLLAGAWRHTVRAQALLVTAPVASGVANAQEYWFVLPACLLEGLVTPWIPVDLQAAWVECCV